MLPELIFCAANNHQHAEIALAAGFRYGAQLPNTVYFPPYFIDQDWTDYDHDAYLAAIQEHATVQVATAQDWEHFDQLETLLEQAEDIAALVEVVVIIPKVPGAVHHLPQRIGGKEVRLGYSVPTSYAGTPVPLAEFGRRPVHLLGGSPEQQMALAKRLNVRSADGNKIMRMANQFNGVWQAQQAPRGFAKNRRYPQLKDLGLGHLREKTYLEAFKLAAQNVMHAWKTGEFEAQLPLF